jgi:hypothetical protein
MRPKVVDSTWRIVSELNKSNFEKYGVLKNSKLIFSHARHVEAARAGIEPKSSWLLHSSPRSSRHVEAGDRQKEAGARQKYVQKEAGEVRPKGGRRSMSKRRPELRPKGALLVAKPATLYYAAGGWII